MSKIIYIDLCENSIIEKVNDSSDYGRVLISRIISDNVPPDTDRLDHRNIVVLTPGLFSGTVAPSTGRLLIGTKASKENGIQISNMAGTFSQKLASLDIQAVVISGKNNLKHPLTILIDENGVSLNYIDDIKGLEVSSTIVNLHALYGKDCGIIGIGPSGENMLKVSSLFSTYPEGNPAFYCARNGIGDIFGHKDIKAIVVKNKAHFNAPVYDEENFRKSSKALSKIIIEHPICGKALPGLGSITLMKMMESGSNIDLGEASNKKGNITHGLKINRTCSPLCVVGCLNRHAKSGNDFYSAPAESEAYAALKDSFGIEDKQYVKQFTNKCFELGIDCMEFIFSCDIYFKMQNIKGTMESLDNAIEELRNMTLIGRVIGSKTDGIYNLFRDKEKFKQMVSKPSIVEENNFNLNIVSKVSNFPDLSDLDYLYAYIIVLENLGFCLFTSFAFIDSDIALTILSDLYYYKTGQIVKPKKMLEYGLKALEYEKKYEEKVKSSSISKTIPNFVKVLYRYFDKN